VPEENREFSDKRPMEEKHQEKKHRFEAGRFRRRSLEEKKDSRMHTAAREVSFGERKSIKKRLPVRRRKRYGGEKKKGGNGARPKAC